MLVPFRAVCLGPHVPWLRVSSCVQGAKSKFYDVMARANSSADPEDIQVG